MFQTPQQRAGSGIMAGVAPVQGYENGGSVPEYTPKFLREEEEEGITDNALFKAFVVDKDDPFDVGLSIAAAGMAATAAPTRSEYRSLAGTVRTVHPGWGAYRGDRGTLRHGTAGDEPCGRPDGARRAGRTASCRGGSAGRPGLDDGART